MPFWIHTILEVYTPLYTAGRDVQCKVTASPHMLAVLRIGEVRRPLSCTSTPALDATQGQMDDFLSQLPFKCYLPEVASV